MVANFISTLIFTVSTKRRPDNFESRAGRRLRRSNFSTRLNAVLCLTVFTMFASLGPAISFAEDAAHDHEEQTAQTLPQSRNQVMKFTDKGVEPSALTLRPEDSIVFFLNKTSDSLVTMEIDYKEHITHCAGGILAVGKNGLLASTRPLEPGNFATTCFHEAGSYPVKIFGLNGKKDPEYATITVR